MTSVQKCEKVPLVHCKRRWYNI